MSQIRSRSFFSSFSENEPRSDHDLDQIISRSFSEFSFSLFGNVKTSFSIKMVHYLIINFQHFQTKGTIYFIFSSKNNSGFNFLLALIKILFENFKKHIFRWEIRLYCLKKDRKWSDLDHYFFEKIEPNPITIILYSMFKNWAGSYHFSSKNDLDRDLI